MNPLWPSPPFFSALPSLISRALSNRPFGLKGLFHRRI